MGGLVRRGLDVTQLLGDQQGLLAAGPEEVGQQARGLDAVLGGHREEVEERGVRRGEAEGHGGAPVR